MVYPIYRKCTQMCDHDLHDATYRRHPHLIGNAVTSKDAHALWRELTRNETSGKHWYYFEHGERQS